MDSDSNSSYDMLKMFQQVRDMSELMNLNNSPNINPDEGTTQAQSHNNMDIENMMKTIEMFNKLKSCMDNNCPSQNNGFGSYNNFNAYNPNPYPNNDNNITSPYFSPDFSPQNFQSPAIKSIQAAIPYVDPRYRRPLAMFIKIIEIQELLNYYTNIIDSMKNQTGDDWKKQMLISIRPNVDPQKQGMIDTMIRMLDMKMLMENMKK